ncbi:MAG TPA: hypothetical protein VGK13_07340 [Methanocellaceae archaeon]|jgi:hypothetical protein
MTELYMLIAVLASAAGALAFLLVHKKSGTGTFFYLCLCSTLVFISTCAAAIGSLSPALIAYAGPLVDISIALFGVSMAAASGWLAYTFKLAGERFD